MLKMEERDLSYFKIYAEYDPIVVKGVKDIIRTQVYTKKIIITKPIILHNRMIEQKNMYI